MGIIGKLETAIILWALLKLYLYASSPFQGCQELSFGGTRGGRGFYLEGQGHLATWVFLAYLTKFPDPPRSPKP